MIITTATELPRLMHCLGSYEMPAALPPDADTEARDEGNAAHWLAKEKFEGRPVLVGQKAYNGYIITEDMMDHVADYLDALDCGEMEVVTSFGTDRYEIGARADHIKYRPSHLTVDDFKYGHRLVPVEENWTLLAHAMGYCIRNGVQPDRITLRIHQPRAYHPDGPLREWAISYQQLLHYHAQLNEHLSNPVMVLNTNMGICAKCPALAICPAARTAGMNAIDASSVVFTDTLPNNVLTWELETLRNAQQTIENRLNALEELVIYKIKQGNVMEGFGLKPRYANSKWKNGLTGSQLTMLTGVNCVKDGTITPAQAKRLGVPEGVVKALTERPMIGTKLERVDVNRMAQRMFGDTAQS